jgi:hypothetical protein
MGHSSFALCLQGGGVFVVFGSNVTITSSSIYGNTASLSQGGGIRVNQGSVSLINCQVHSNQASSVRALMFKSSHRPDGRLTFCSLFLQGGGVAISVWGGTVSIVNSQIYSNTATNDVRADVRNFPSPPRGRLTICLLFAGRRCLRPFRHGHDVVFLNLREYSFWKCACLCGKLPIAPMGKCLADMSNLTLAFLAF